MKLDSPSRIISAMQIPTAGASLKPCPLNPVQMYSPFDPIDAVDHGMQVRGGGVESGVTVRQLALFDSGDSLR